MDGQAIPRDGQAIPRDVRELAVGRGMSVDIGCTTSLCLQSHHPSEATIQNFWLDSSFGRFPGGHHVTVLSLSYVQLVAQQCDFPTLHTHHIHSVHYASLGMASNQDHWNTAIPEVTIYVPWKVLSLVPQMVESYW